MFNKDIIRKISIGLVSVMVMSGVFYSFTVEASANPNSYSLTEEEIEAAKERTSGVADIIMTADDFLFDGESVADFEDIHAYVDDLKKNGIDSKHNERIKEEAANADNDADNTENNSNEQADNYSAADEQPISQNSFQDAKDAAVNNSDNDDWRLILVNKQNPVPDDYDATLSNINASLMADERIIDDIYSMLDAAKEDGVDLMICSAYRSYDRQTTLFNNKMNKLMARGMSYMDAYQVGSMSVTVPGTSEHQLGLALDILTSAYTSMDDGFGETEAGKWLAKYAPNYGFILRYPKGKEQITGIIYEPWHFRYVGKEYALEITDLGVALEEYLNGDY